MKSEENNKKKLSKENLTLFLSDLLLINSSFELRNDHITKCIKEYVKETKKFYRFELDSKFDEINKEYARACLENYMAASAIMSMYHLFEQYLNVEFNIKKSGNSSILSNLYEKCKKYNYNIYINTYYEEVNLYRLIANSLKHGKIYKTLKKEHPELIKADDKYGTLLNDSLCIKEKEVNKCLVSLSGFVKELIDYFEDMGYSIK